MRSRRETVASGAIAVETLPAFVRRRAERICTHRTIRESAASASNRRSVCKVVGAGASELAALSSELAPLSGELAAVSCELPVEPVRDGGAVIRNAHAVSGIMRPRDASAAEVPASESAIESASEASVESVVEAKAMEEASVQKDAVTEPAAAPTPAAPSH